MRNAEDVARSIMSVYDQRADQDAMTSAIVLALMQYSKPVSAQDVLDWVKALNDSKRASFFDALRAYYCLSCGAADPRCQCDNYD